MKSLTEIQLELRKLTQVMETLNIDIEALKAASASNEINFMEQLEAIGEKYPMHNKYLAHALEYQKRYYMQLLGTIAGRNSHALREKLLYLYRISKGSKCGFSMEEIKKFEVISIEKVLPEITTALAELRYCLILDALMIVNIDGNATEEELLFIAELAMLLNCDDEDMMVMAQLATALLERNQDKFTQIVAKKRYSQLNYLIPEEWLENIKWEEVYVNEGEITGMSCEGKFLKLEGDMLVRDRQWVEKNQIIFKGKVSSSSVYVASLYTTQRSNEPVCIKSPMNGFMKLKKTDKTGGFMGIQIVYEIWIINSFADESDFK